jgi:hypothetical protein
MSATTKKHNSLLQRLIKNSTGKNTAMMSESIMFTERDVIPTEIPIINAAFSGGLDGGVPAGLTVLAGPSKHFKSNLALVCVKAYLDKYDDAVCVLYDSEGGVTPSYLKTFGVDPDRVVHIPIEHIEMLKFDMVNQLKELERKDHVIFMIDSIGNTASLKELEDAQNEKSVADMQRAKGIKSLFRMVTPSFVAKDVPCICIAHTYQELGLYPKQIISGGCMVAGTEIIMYDGSRKEIQDVEVGDFVLTLEGGREVSDVWNPETLLNGTPECFEVEFDDGLVVTVSDEHQFLTTTGWVAAKNLKANLVVAIEETTGGAKTIKRVTPVGQKPVYDISVREVEHYVLSNGVVTHNTGIMYSANQAFLIGKSQEKDGDEIVGWNFTLVAEKSRYVKEKSRFTFTVKYDGGIDKYSGIMDLALEFGFVIKPKNGWYQLVDIETGEAIGQNVRLKATGTPEFLGVVMKNPKFQDMVKGKYTLGAGSSNNSESLEDIDPDADED